MATNATAPAAGDGSATASLAPAPTPATALAPTPAAAPASSASDPVATHATLARLSASLQETLANPAPAAQDLRPLFTAPLAGLEYWLRDYADAIVTLSAFPTFVHEFKDLAAAEDAITAAVADAGSAAAVRTAAARVAAAGMGVFASIATWAETNDVAARNDYLARVDASVIPPLRDFVEALQGYVAAAPQPDSLRGDTPPLSPVLHSLSANSLPDTSPSPQPAAAAAPAVDSAYERLRSVAGFVAQAASQLDAESRSRASVHRAFLERAAGAARAASAALHELGETRGDPSSVSRLSLDVMMGVDQVASILHQLASSSKHVGVSEGCNRAAAGVLAAWKNFDHNVLEQYSVSPHVASVVADHVRTASALAVAVRKATVAMVEYAAQPETHAPPQQAAEQSAASYEPAVGLGESFARSVTGTPDTRSTAPVRLDDISLVRATPTSAGTPAKSSLATPAPASGTASDAQDLDIVQAYGALVDSASLMSTKYRTLRVRCTTSAKAALSERAAEGIKRATKAVKKVAFSGGDPRLIEDYAADLLRNIKRVVRVMEKLSMSRALSRDDRKIARSSVREVTSKAVRLLESAKVYAKKPSEPRAQGVHARAVVEFAQVVNILVTDVTDYTLPVDEAGEDFDFSDTESEAEAKAAHAAELAAQENAAAEAKLEAERAAALQSAGANLRFAKFRDVIAAVDDARGRSLIHDPDIGGYLAGLRDSLVFLIMHQVKYEPELWSEQVEKLSAQSAALVGAVDAANTNATLKYHLANAGRAVTAATATYADAVTAFVADPLADPWQAHNDAADSLGAAWLNWLTDVIPADLDLTEAAPAFGAPAPFGSPQPQAAQQGNPFASPGPFGSPSASPPAAHGQSQGQGQKSGGGCVVM
ncbi:uncharacterized protein AMSG_05958 [Thecamonas trahens ATCC 50062]|uniref:Uncharacterized protein n=1 Tax=Thecamonas trahens ATCC 50062 TaxID=461836 RepID=A0A0L0DBT8_THETB|nr:hypothetical protein AMSG_05958 [Thecamonas trahens ATCC 50062]KNC49695.1 hypothetical protein AMSG_05958 [Thecamonas trahens ATCC 50062]|eukprot:XP_013757490.1 hypothetical protein AMSG_05958 [Thecamonas trahens ATCC 50062]